MFMYLNDACRMLGHKGICIEGLEVLCKLRGILTEDTRNELDDFMKRGREMFAPADELEEADG